MAKKARGILSVDSLGGLTAEKRVLVAISGGLDSVVLAHWLHAAGITIELAHVNYGLRGKESDLDEQLVRDLSQALGVPVWVLDARNVQKPSGSIQPWARKLRYEWFITYCTSGTMDTVVTAHHADDQLETMLLNLLRGGELAGLSGMQSSRVLDVNVSLVRPLLGVTKSRLKRYAVQHGLKWREDASNSNKRYLRNGIRAELEALDEQTYASFLEAGQQLSRHISDARTAILRALQQATDGRIELSLTEWEDIPDVFQGLVLLDIMGYLDPQAPRRASSIHRLKRLLHGPVGKRAQLGRIRVWKERSGLVFVTDTLALTKPSSMHPMAAGEVFWELQADLKSDAEMPFTFEKRRVEEVSVRGNSSKQAALDLGKITFPLRIRRWRPGDAFRPLGVDGSQKVKKFLTQRKMASHQRGDVMVMESNDTIVWVVGHQIDHRFRVTDGTREVLFITWHSNSVE